MHNELEIDEQLDALDPLRHLRIHDELDLVPAQPPSIRNQTLQLSFPSAHVPDPVQISLLVDASPGCGGIAWPAGEVRSRRTPSA